MQALRAVSPFLGARGAVTNVGAAGRAVAPALHAGGARRAAGGGKFAAFKVKKANWVEVRVLPAACSTARTPAPLAALAAALAATLRPPSPRQSNEILRENQFFTWSLSRSNMIGVTVMALAFPLAFHYLNKAELERRDVACVVGPCAACAQPRFSARRGAHHRRLPRHPALSQLPRLGQAPRLPLSKGQSGALPRRKLRLPLFQVLCNERNLFS